MTRTDSGDRKSNRGHRQVDSAIVALEGIRRLAASAPKAFEDLGEAIDEAVEAFESNRPSIGLLHLARVLGIASKGVLRLERERSSAGSVFLRSESVGNARPAREG